MTDFTTTHTLEELVAAYIERYFGMYTRIDNVIEKRDKNFWATETMSALAKNEPDKALESILKILNATEDEFVLSNLAAGPLEDLLRFHGPIIISKIEEIAKSDERFLNLLFQVYKVPPDDVWSRIAALLEKNQG